MSVAKKAHAKFDQIIRGEIDEPRAAEHSCSNLCSVATGCPCCVDAHAEGCWLHCGCYDYGPPQSGSIWTRLGDWWEGRAKPVLITAAAVLVVLAAVIGLAVAAMIGGVR